VLSITASSIVLLLAYLLVMEFLVGSDVRQAYERILSSSKVGAEFIGSERLSMLASDMSALRQDPGRTWSAASSQNAQEVLKSLDGLPSITPAQLAQLRACVTPLPVSDTGRDSKLEACATMLSNVRQAALQSAGLIPDAQIASDSAARIHEQRQSLHGFWVQAAQLVLLNLLLPLLTALFGYVFGTQQAQQRASEQ
jgi:hypothetical protein